MRTHTRTFDPISFIAPHDYDRSPYPASKKHRAPQSAQQAWEDYYGEGKPEPRGRRAAK